MWVGSEVNGVQTLVSVDGDGLRRVQLLVKFGKQSGTLWECCCQSVSLSVAVDVAEVVW